MKPRIAFVMIAICVTLFALVGAAGPQQKSSPARQVWEYRSALSLSDEQLSGLGAEGWELVGFSVDESRNRYFCFKRPK